MEKSLPSPQSSSARLSAPIILSFLLAAMIVMGGMFPRSLSYMPPFIGLVSLGILWFSVKESMRQFWSPFIAVGGVMAFASLSALWSIDAEDSLDRCIKMALVLVPGSALIYSARCLEVRNFTLFFKALPICVIFAMGWNIFEIVSDGLFYKWVRDLPMDDPDYYPSAHNRSILVALMLVPMSLVAVQISDWSQRSKHILQASMFAGVIGLALVTESQSAHLIIVLALVCYFALPITRKPVLYTVLLGIALLLVAAPFVVQIAFGMFAESMGEYEWFRESYARERLEIWDFVSRYALQNPLYGFGIEATRAVESFDSAMLYRGVATVLHPHNFAIQIWMEFGVIGVVAGFIFIAYMLRNIAQYPPVLAQVFFATFIAVMAVASTAYGLWQGWWLGTFVAFAAIGVALGRCYDAQKTGAA